MQINADFYYLSFPRWRQSTLYPIRHLKLALNWLCFFAAQNRKNLHISLSYNTLSRFAMPANWLCFFKTRHTIYHIRNTKKEIGFVFSSSLSLFFAMNYELRTVNHNIGFVLSTWIIATKSTKGLKNGRIYFNFTFAFCLITFAFP